MKELYDFLENLLKYNSLRSWWEIELLCAIHTIAITVRKCVK